MPTEVKTPVGRVVWGHPGKMAQKRDPNTKALVNKPDGTPAMQTAFGLAIPKAEFIASVWPAMLAEASTKYPNGQVPPRFSWKYVDGDSVDSQGKPYSQREGYAGCYVLTITSNTGFPPALYRFNPQTRQYDQLTAEQVKTGDYIVAALSLQVNVPTDRTQTPSLYVNPQAIEFVGYGNEIVSSGVDPMAAFGGVQHALPPGASATPMAPAHNVGMPGMPAPAPVPGYPQPGQPAPAPMPGYAPQPQPAPAPGMMPGYAPAPAPAPVPGYPQPGQPMPAPAHDFVQPGGPAPVPGYPPQPAPAPYPGQPMPGAPAGMPGMPGPR